MRLASYRWIDPDTYTTIKKDEIWVDEENDKSIPKKPPNSHKVSIEFHTSIKILLTRASDHSSYHPKEYHAALSHTKRFSDR